MCRPRDVRVLVGWEESKWAIDRTGHRSEKNLVETRCKSAPCSPDSDGCRADNLRIERLAVHGSKRSANRTEES